MWAIWTSSRNTSSSSHRSTEASRVSRATRKLYKHSRMVSRKGFPLNWLYLYNSSLNSANSCSRQRASRHAELDFGRRPLVAATRGSNQWRPTRLQDPSEGRQFDENSRTNDAQLEHAFGWLAQFDNRCDVQHSSVRLHTSWRWAIFQAGKLFLSLFQFLIAHLFCCRNSLSHSLRVLMLIVSTFI